MRKRILIPFLVLALLLSACGRSPALIAEQYNGSIFHIDTAAQTITLDDTVYQYEIEDRSSSTQYTIIYPDGAVYSVTMSEFTGVGGGDTLYYQSDRLDGDILIDILEETQPGQKDPLQIVFGLVFIALGVLNIAKPRIIWYLRYGWHYQDAEPSDLSLIFARLSGIIILVPGMLLLFF